MKIRNSRKILLFLALILAFGWSSTAFGAATIVINNINAAGVGFNETTPATPVGGNNGTTLGEQRLLAFQEAARIWGATLTSTPTITINAQFTPLTCTATSATLGSAGANGISRDFAGAPFSGTWYSSALRNKIVGSDSNTTSQEINANFNSNLGKPGCLENSPFYLGFDGNEGTGIDLVATLLHEFGHGLGFQTFTNGSTGAQNGGFPSVWDRFMLDNTTGKSWFNMTATERMASALNARNLVWDGPQVQADVPSVLAVGTPLLKINSPAGIAGNYLVGAASFGPQLTASGITGNVVQAIDPNDAAGTSTTDGCSPLTNAAAVAGNIALIDRGTCGFIVKVQNAQAAGAIAVIIADNAAGTPPAALGGVDPGGITIPAVRITQADGNTIKGQLSSGSVNVTLTVDQTVRQGADAFGKAQLFTPNPFQSGSSVSHWDTSASPNLLMEPSINNDLTHEVTPPSDLTFSLFKDIGWETTNLPTAIAVSGGNLQTTAVNQSFTNPLQVTVSPAVAGLIVTFTATTGTGGATGTFANSGSRSEIDDNNAVAVTNNSRAATAVTNAAGVATSPALKANGSAGTYTINATVAGAGTTAFQAINTLAPTAAAASVSGRILTTEGRGVANASVILTDTEGNVRVARTNAFGHFQLSDISAGANYTVTINHKQHRFAPALISVGEDLSDLLFIALP